MSIGQSGGKVQSLILGCTLIIIGVLVFIIGILADTIAANRRILQDIQFHVKSIEYGRHDPDLNILGSHRRKERGA
jgi:hypothetical protein